MGSDAPQWTQGRSGVAGMGIRSAAELIVNLPQRPPHCIDWWSLLRGYQSQQQNANRIRGKVHPWFQTRRVSDLASRRSGHNHGYLGPCWATKPIQSIPAPPGAQTGALRPGCRKSYALVIIGAAGDVLAYLDELFHRRLIFTRYLSVEEMERRESALANAHKEPELECFPQERRLTRFSSGHPRHVACQLRDLESSSSEEQGSCQRLSMSVPLISLRGRSNRWGCSYLVRSDTKDPGPLCRAPDEDQRMKYE